MTGSLPLLSVVVPVGRVDEHFDVALDALRSQCHAHLEIIVVLDGVGSLVQMEVERLVRQDDRVRVVVVQERSGAGNARNVGLRHATGDFVAFADADDLVPLEAYERLLTALTQSGSDLVSGRAEQFAPNGVRSTYWTVDDDLWETGGTALQLADTPQLAFDHTPWNKVFRRAWLRDAGVEFPVGTTCEDVSWWASIVVKAVVDVLPEVVYNHRRHDGSVTSGIQRGDDLEDWILQTTAAIDTYAAHGAELVLAILGRRLVRREAWTRVRRIGLLGPDGRRSLGAFVQWISTWTNTAEFDGLSTFPRTAYALVRLAELELAAAFIAVFAPPSDDAVVRWSAVAPELGAVFGETDQLASDLWRECLFRPLLDAAQRDDAAPVRPQTVVDFWDTFVTVGLDEHERRVLAALRAGSLNDVAFLRRNRRLRATASRRGRTMTVMLSGLDRPSLGRVVQDRAGVTTVIHDGVLSDGTLVLAVRLRGSDRLRLEFPMSGGRSHSVDVVPAQTGRTAAVRLARRLAARGLR